MTVTVIVPVIPALPTMSMVYASIRRVTVPASAERVSTQSDAVIRPLAVVPNVPSVEGYVPFTSADVEGRQVACGSVTWPIVMEYAAPVVGKPCPV